MHEIPESMAQVAALAKKSQTSAAPLTEDDVIRLGLQNWAQELLDEGIEGGYLTAKLEETQLSVFDSDGKELASLPNLTAKALLPKFKEHPHETLMYVQTAMRKLLDSGKFNQ